MSKIAYENLDIYKSAERLSQLIYRSVKQWPAFDRDTLGKQIARAADSIGANIAEGFGRGNCPDQKRMLRIARGSPYEVKHWLRTAFNRELLKSEDVVRLKPLIEELPPRLNAYIRAVGRNRQSTINIPQSMPVD